MDIQSATIPLEKPLIIRKAEQGDLPALEWNGEYRHFRTLYSDIYQHSQRGNALMWVLELPGSGVIGQLFIQLVSARKELADGFSRAYLYAFRIQPQYRSMGLGSQLITYVEADLFRRRFRWVTLNVAKNNDRARRFYERHGYHIVADEPGRWSYTDELGNRRDVVEPAWRMEKDLLG